MPSPGLQTADRGASHGVSKGMCVCFAEETSLSIADHKKKKKRKKILIISANQAPVGSVPGEAVHADLLREACPPLGRLPENCTTLWKL